MTADIGTLERETQVARQRFRETYQAKQQWEPWPKSGVPMSAILAKIHWDEAKEKFVLAVARETAAKWLEMRRLGQQIPGLDRVRPTRGTRPRHGVDTPGTHPGHARPGAGRPGRGVSEKRIAMWLWAEDAYRDTEITIAEIAAVIGVSSGAVSVHMKKRGLRRYRKHTSEGSNV